jgi:hypothetical protein
MLKGAVGLMSLVFVASSSLACAQQASNPRINQVDMKALMDARIAVVKDALQLTPDQAKYWPAVEDAMRARAQARYARFTAVADQLAPGREVDPIAIFRGRADAMAQRADELRKLVDAWEPLSRSLAPNQKERMRLLATAGVMPTLCPLLEGYPDCM